MSMVQIKNLMPGMLVDLEGDRYADPRRTNRAYQFEYQRVVDVVPETTDCICVYFAESNPVGFPPNHEVFVLEET